MILSSKVVALPLFEDEKENAFVQVEFSDGTFVNLNEEELKNAAALAEKGCLSD